MSYINKEELIRRMQVAAPMNWTDEPYEQGEEAQYKHDRQVIESCVEVKAIPIPPRATNGDMFMTTFAIKEINAMIKTIFVILYDGTELEFKRDWWNAPYKEEVNRT